MIPLSVKVPFAGEAVSVFKSACDFIVHSEQSESKLTQLSDEEFKFSESITVGVFRLLLDGTLTVVDKDLDNLVSIMTLTSKDRGGKGKLDAKIRLYIEENELACDAEVTPKGMLTRVELPIEKVFSDKIVNILELAMTDSSSHVVIDDYAQEPIKLASVESESVEDLDIEALSKLVSSSALRKDDSSNKPIWVVLLQLPINILTWPINLLRKLC